MYTLYKTHAHTHAEVHTLFLFLKHYTPKNVSAHTCTFVGAGCGGVSGAAQDSSSEFVFLSGVGEVGGGEGVAQDISAAVGKL